MPEAILKYKLPEEKSEFNVAAKAELLALILWDIDQHLRAEVKYKGKQEAQLIRDELHNIAESYDINIINLLE